jgi:hypothetical protein
MLVVIYLHPDSVGLGSFLMLCGADKYEQTPRELMKKAIDKQKSSYVGVNGGDISCSCSCYDTFIYPHSGQYFVQEII